MADKPRIRHYRIGDYAKKMGVTPDLLKHYESMGLLQAQTTENGYRYYPFSESIPLLECFSLRNYNVPLQQIHDLLYKGSLTELQTALAERAEAFRQRITRDQAMIQEYEEFEHWLGRMNSRNIYLLLEETEDVYFLPHSQQHNFLDDDRIQSLLPHWIEWMPVVKSCRKILYEEKADCLRDAYWGLAVPASKAKAYGIPLNDVVERLPGGRHLTCHYLMKPSPAQPPNTVWHQVQEQLTQKGISPSGPIQQVVYASLFAPENAAICGYFSIPLS